MNRRDALPLLLLILLPALWWWPLLVGWLPDFMDTVTLFYPYRMAAARQVWQGTLPLWLPEQMLGMPLAANPQAGVWYPPGFLFHALPHPVSYGVLILFHYWLAGVGGYWLVRRLAPGGGACGAALMAGVLIQFGAMMVSRVAVPANLFPVAWVPVILLAVEQAARGGRAWWPPRACMVVAVLVAMHFLAGGPQITYYLGLMLPVWWLGRAVQLRARGESRIRAAGRGAMHGAVAAGVALLLVGVQLLPTLDFVAQCERASIPTEKLVGQALNGAQYWRALIGGTGSPLEDTDTINAIGLGGMALALAGLWHRRRRPVVALLLALGFGSYLLSSGALVPLWSDWLPGYNRFHAPRRALVMWSIVGPVAAGLGAASLSGVWRHRRWPRAALTAIMVAAVASAAVLLPRLERRFADPARFNPPPGMPAEVADGRARYLTIDPTLNYAYGSRAEDYGASLLPNMGVWLGLLDAQGNDPLVLRRVGMMRNLACEGTGVFYPSHGVYLTDPTSPVLGLLAVQLLVGDPDYFDPGRVIAGADFSRAHLEAITEPIAGAGTERWPWRRYRAHRPMAWWVEATVAVPTAEQALLGAARAADPLSVAFVESPTGLPRRARAAPPNARYTDARTLTVTTDAPTGGFLCVSVPWMDNAWKATAHGEEGRTEAVFLQPANGFLVGAIVPEWARRVELRYSPVAFQRGVAMTMLGVLVVVIGWRRRRSAA